MIGSISTPTFVAPSAPAALAGDDAASAAATERLRRLQEIDRRVRAHEQAHISAGQGVVSGGASFTYARGPDGRSYAIGGEVPIDVSKGRTPTETLQKAAAVQRAALAPADPSGQDRRVAAQAAAMAAEAATELQQARRGGAEASGFYRRVAGDSGVPNAGGIDTYA